MADQSQIESVKQGATAWNTWRKQHPGVEVDLSRADLSRADLSYADLRAANLNGANLSRADLSSARLNGADLSVANLGSARLNVADLSYSDLSYANLSGADLSYANLNGADLNRADLNGANLNRADLSGANLSGVNLSGADFNGADFNGADLNGADFNGADLNGANLSGANLNGANLSGANLSGANLWGTTLANLDLRSVQGLIEIRHVGPSFVSLHSIQLPQDGSALHFLRGVGIPDEWIDFYRSTMMQPIQYQSVFISYSSDDESISKRLHADLQANGVRCWFAPHDLKPGDDFREKINQAIHMQDKLLLILSEKSVTSKWVKYEVNRALNREVEQERAILFPIRLDDLVLHVTEGWAADLRAHRHIGNFTNWKDHATYLRSFDQLLKQLKAATR